MTFGREGAGIGINADADSTLLILGGEPIDEPVVGYGPFVMNTEAEIRRAIQDYQSGRMGHLAPDRRLVYPSLKVCNSRAMGSPIRVLVSCGLLLAGWGCASDDRGPILARDPRVATSQVGEMQLNIRLMLSFDANKDGLVTRDEVEAGLRVQFEAGRYRPQRQPQFERDSGGERQALAGERNGVFSLDRLESGRGRRFPGILRDRAFGLCAARSR